MESEDNTYMPDDGEDTHTSAETEEDTSSAAEAEEDAFSIVEAEGNTSNAAEVEKPYPFSEYSDDSADERVDGIFLAETVGKDKEYWEKIKWEWLDVNKGLQKLQEDHDKWKGAQGRDKPQSATSAPKDSGRKALVQGSWHFAKYIPAWSDPDWSDDLYAQVDENGQEIRRPHRDVYRQLRPALRLGDAVRNPTPYAQRFGIFPGRTDGRSLTSPTVSQTRRVALPRPMPVPSGAVRDYLTWDDFHAANTEFDQSGEAKTFQSLKDCLEQKILDPDKADISEGLLTFLRVLNEEKEYQMTLFDLFITDDLVEARSHFIGDVPDADLQGPLHDLLQRKMWHTPLNRGLIQEDPKLLYNLGGFRGEFEGSDDLVWKAMQPALQLVTRILNANHPMWLAILDICKRRPVPRERDARRDREIEASGIPNRTSIHLQVDENKTFPAVRKLIANGFNSVPETTDLLRQRLSFNFFSGHEKSTVLGDPSPDMCCAWTWSCHTFDCDRSRIRIEVAAEMVWPLLVPTYSPAEKASSSFLIAVTILHELCHAVEFAHSVMMLAQKVYLKTRSTGSLAPIPPQMMNKFQNSLSALLELGQKTHTLGHLDDKFWQEEGRAELGFAYENQLWGGTVGTLTGQLMSTTYLQLMPFSLYIGGWPSTTTAPHRITGGDKLRNPPPRVDTYMNLPSIPNVANLFQQSFWGNEFRKYGFTALKMHATTHTKVTVICNMLRRRDLARTVGPHTSEWVWMAMLKLRAAGHNLLSRYLHELIFQKLGFRRVSKRWKYESRTWQWRNNEAGRLHGHFVIMGGAFRTGTSMRKQSPWYREDQLRQKLEQYHKGVAEGRINPTLVPVPTMAMYDEFINMNIGMRFNNFLRSAEEMHLFLTRELQYTQFMTSEFLSLDPNSQRRLQQEYQNIWSRLNEPYERIAAESVNYLSNLKRDIVNEGLETRPHILEDIDRLGQKLQLDQNSFSEVSQLLASNDRGKTFSNFSAGLRHNKVQMLTKLADREILLLDDDVVKTIVDQVRDVLQALADIDISLPQPPAIEQLVERIKQQMDLIREINPPKKLEEKKVDKGKKLEEKKVPKKLEEKKGGKGIFDLAQHGMQPRSNAPTAGPGAGLPSELAGLELGKKRLSEPKDDGSPRKKARTELPPQAAAPVLKVPDNQMSGHPSAHPLVMVPVLDPQSGFTQYTLQPGGFSKAADEKSVFAGQTGIPVPDSRKEGPATTFTMYPDPFATSKTVTDHLVREGPPLQIANTFGGPIWEAAYAEARAAKLKEWVKDIPMEEEEKEEEKKDGGEGEGKGEEKREKEVPTYLFNTEAYREPEETEDD